MSARSSAGKRWSAASMERRPNCSSAPPSASAAWRRSSSKTTSTLSPASAAARAAHGREGGRCVLRDAATGRLHGASETATTAGRRASAASYPSAAPPPSHSNRAACQLLHENRRAPQGTTRSSVENPTAEFPDHHRKVKLFCKNRGLWREKEGVRATVGPRSIATARPVGTFPNAKGVDQLFVSFSAE